MRRLILIGLIMLALVSVTVAQEGTGIPGEGTLGDSYYPELGNSGYDVQHYTLDLFYDFDDRLLEGMATIEAIPLHHLSSLNLDFIGMDIETLTINGEPAEFERQGLELTIIPEAALPEGEPFTVTVAYSGLPQAFTPEAIPVNMGWNHYDRGVYVASEPIGASTFFPANEHPLDKATYTMRITVPQPYVVAANGLLMATTTDDTNNTITYLWENDDPTASYLVTVNIGEFVIEEQEGPEGLPIRNYFPVEVAEDASYDFGRTAEMIAFYNEQFGPYPFDAYGAVVANTQLGFALETQTLSLFGLRHVDGQRSSEETVAHELVHQWFGDSVSLSDWSDIWLNEGFATYGAKLWVEHLYGTDMLNEQMAGIYNFLKQMEAILPPPGAPPADDLFNTSVYIRGAMTLHALRARVGDELFFEFVRAYYDTYKYGNATTEGLIAIAEEISGQELDEFFNGWLYEQELPPIPELGWGIG